MVIDVGSIQTPCRAQSNQSVTDSSKSSERIVGEAGWLFLMGGRQSGRAPECIFFPPDDLLCRIVSNIFCEFVHWIEDDEDCISSNFGSHGHVVHLFRIDQKMISVPHFAKIEVV